MRAALTQLGLQEYIGRIEQEGAESVDELAQLISSQWISYSEEEAFSKIEGKFSKKIWRTSAKTTSSGGVLVK